MNLNTIFFIGPQGSGKGTQARKLAKRLNFFYPAPFSKTQASDGKESQSPTSIADAMKTGKWGGVYWEMGGGCREIATQQTDLGKQVKQMVDSGILLPDDLLLKVIAAKLSQIPQEQGVIFDGIPRRLGQAEFLMDFLKKQGRTNFTTLFIDLPKEDSIKRLLLRAQTENRADDTKETIKLRLEQYYNDTLPVLDYLKKQTQFIEIDGTPSIENVTKSINQKLGLSLTTPPHEEG